MIPLGDPLMSKLAEHLQHIVVVFRDVCGWLCCIISNYSSVVRFKWRYFGGGKSCLVALMILDFGRVMNLT